MNPARDFDDAKLEAMANDPAGSTGWPSRYGRCFAGEVLRLRRERMSAVDCLLDIAAMGKKSVSEMAKHRLRDLGIDWETGEPIADYWRAHAPTD